MTGKAKFDNEFDTLGTNNPAKIGQFRATKRRISKNPNEIV